MSLSDFHSEYFDVACQGEIAVVTISVQQLTDESNVEVLGNDLFSLIEQHGQRKIILRLAYVSYLTSSVLGKLISLHRRMHRSDGHLVLCELQPEVREVFELSRLIDYFKIVDTLADAHRVIQMAS